MKNPALILACLLTVLAGVVKAEDLPASRPPEPGCTWKRHEFKDLGVRLLFQDCKNPDQPYELSVKDNRLEMHRPSNDVIFGSRCLLEVFSKPAKQSIKDAIKDNFVDKIELQDKVEEHLARESCRVTAFSNVALRGDKVTLTIMPSGKYGKRIDKELKEGPRDFGCGQYGRGQSWTYFEYHPLESVTKYAFVVYGQDAPLLDENSIEFLK
jgi:hypothetical protein